MQKFLITFLAVLLLISAAYTGVWFYFGSKISGIVEKSISNIGEDDPNLTLVNSKVSLKGFPKEFVVSWQGDIQLPQGTLKVPNLKAKGWFVPGSPIDVSTPQGMHVKTSDGTEHKLDRLNLSLTMPKNWPGATAGIQALSEWQKTQEKVDIHKFEILMDEKGFHLHANGYLTLDKRLQPAGIIKLQFADVRLIEDKKKSLQEEIKTNKDLDDKQKKKMFQQIGTLSALTSTEDMSYTLRILNNTIKLSIIPLTKFPVIRWPDKQAENITQNTPITPQPAAAQ